MFKIILSIIFFIVLIYTINHYWDKADDVNKRKIAGMGIAILIVTLSLSIYLIID